MTWSYSVCTGPRKLAAWCKLDFITRKTTNDEFGTIRGTNVIGLRGADLLFGSGMAKHWPSVWLT